MLAPWATRLTILAKEGNRHLFLGKARRQIIVGELADWTPARPGCRTIRERSIVQLGGGYDRI
jgi:hypothetical protein